VNELHVVVIVSQVPENVCKQSRKTVNLDIVKLLKCLPVIVRELKQSHFWLVLSLGLWEMKGEVKENT